MRQCVARSFSPDAIERAADAFPQARVEERRYGATPNEEVLRCIPPSAREVLDVGCGSGANAALLAAKGVKVDGITLSPDEAGRAAGHCRSVYVNDLEHGLPEDVDNKYDAVLCSHVLEHIRYPEPLLIDVRRRLKPDGRLVIAVPNLLHYRTRVQLMLGRFEYAEGGIMDSTHFRWYTLETMGRLLASRGFAVERAYGDGNAPLGALRRLAPGVCQRIDGFAARHLPGLFGWQLVFVACLG